MYTNASLYFSIFLNDQIWGERVALKNNINKDERGEWDTYSAIFWSGGLQCHFPRAPQETTENIKKYPGNSTLVDRFRKEWRREDKWKSQHQTLRKLTWR